MASKVTQLVAREFASTFCEVLSKLEKSGGPAWTRPWKGGKKPDFFLPGMPYNGISKRMYTGSNVAILYFKAIARGWGNRWFTFNQLSELGLLFNEETEKKHTKILHFKTYDIPKEKRVDGRDSGVSVRYYRLFNESQLIDPSGSDNWREPELRESDDTIVSNALSKGAKIYHGGDSAFYEVMQDRIVIPEKNVFLSEDSYFATLYHELAHWTGEKSRLNRSYPSPEEDNVSKKEQGENILKKYAWEELVAELASAFLCSQTNRECMVNHVAYLKIWKEKAEKDPVKLMQAGKAASDAALFLLKNDNKKN